MDNSIEIMLSIMPEEEWHHIELAAQRQRVADWMGAEMARKRAGYDLARLNQSERV